MDYRGSKRSSISFGSYQRQLNIFDNVGNNGVNFYQRQNQGSQPQQQLGIASGNSNYTLDKLKTVTSCQYQSSAPLYALSWNQNDQCALGTYKEDSYNRIEIISGSKDYSTWECTHVANVVYPVSRIQWMPQNNTRLATCSDSLRIWSLDGSLQEQINLSLYKYGKHPSSASQKDTATLGQLPPVTSFHWSPISPNLLLSCSIDTTCTVWDLSNSTNYVKTQLIAHDSEVFDVKFLAQSTQLFASCGGDGSVRVFDLRSLAHSTIVYEHGHEPAHGSSANVNKNCTAKVTAAGTGASGASAGSGSTDTSQASDSTLLPRNRSQDSNASLGNMDPEPHSNALVRLEPNPFDPNVIVTVAQDSNAIIVLDMRYPGSPLVTLEGHIGPVNQVQWHPKKSGVLVSCGDDCQVLYWDINALLGQTVSNNSRWANQNVVHNVDTPQMAYTTDTEANNLVLNSTGSHVGTVHGKTFTAINLST
ncbi:unnamed protein product [Kluyveromyces dobzhanskii CBS 2104]|uniref:WGS project CCBQ000000000 data, contig 00102 n=1 Tax=Kluyveromyces dobzhanskii CBS 2104 TaxID=1427455 RepID=A0A0A8L472_9SACH|nr:unnamed protein product [Kluyveromyces dobzhanskii CBS 2104]